MKQQIRLVEDKNICAQCKGLCCKSQGCHVAPWDVFKGGKGSIEKLRAFMNTKNYTVDFWAGDPRDNDIWNFDFSQHYFLRARNKNEGFITGYNPNGACAMLTSTGCKLSFNERPTGGKSLVPKPDQRCVPTYTKRQCAIDWIPYQDMLETIIDEFGDLPAPVDKD